MVEVTETNRNPDIDAEVINADSVSADSGTVGTLEATDADIGKLIAALDANNQDVSNVGNLDATALEATDSLTDPSGFTYTGAITPVQVTEEASTFAESDVTVTHNNTQTANGSVDIIERGDFFDDWEDGDLTGWSGDTGNLTNQQETVLTGNSTGELFSSNSFVAVDAPSVGPFQSKIAFKFLIDNDTGNTGDLVRLAFSDDSGASIFGFRFIHSSNDILFEDRTARTTTIANNAWSPGTTHTIIATIDFSVSPRTVDVEFDGATIGADLDTDDSADNWANMEWSQESRDSGGSFNSYVDNYPSPTSGNALIEWGSAVPEDINSWDLATFQRTLDNETVTIDVEDGNGNVLFSDISQNFDISTVDTSKNVKLRANLSRNDTANNPTLDYAARRFTR